MNRPATVIAAAACTLALLAAGCTSSKSGDKATDSAHPSGSGAATTAYSQHPLPPDKSIGNSVDRRKQVAITDCSSTTGGWAASGTARNPGTTSTTYAITVFFTTATATVLDFAQTKVTVDPGKTAKWTAGATFATPKDTRCVLRGVA